MAARNNPSGVGSSHSRCDDGAAAVLSTTCSRSSSEQTESQGDMLSLLPHPLLEAVLQGLSLQDVWNLWQTSRAVQTAVQRCTWADVVELDVRAGLLGMRQTSCSMETAPRQRAWIAVNGAEDGAAALHVFGPGGIRRMRFPSPLLVLDELIHSFDHDVAQRAMEHVHGHVPHVQFLEMDDLTDLSNLCSYFTDMSRFFPSLSSAPSLPWPRLADFSSLRELVCSLDWPEPDPAFLSPLTTLTHLTLRHDASDDAVKVAAQLPMLKSLVLDDVGNLSLSDEALDLAARFEALELRRCSWSGAIPAWLGRLSSAQHLDLSGAEMDVAILASLPALKSLRVEVRNLGPQDRAPAALVSSSSAAAPTPAASSCPRTSAVVRTQPSGHTLFPCLKLLDVTVFGEGALDLGMFPVLEEFCIRGSEMFKPRGSLASMASLVRLEVRGATSERHAFNSSDLALLRTLKSATISPQAFRRPFDIGALWHVESVVIDSQIPEVEELRLGQLAGGASTAIESLTCESINPLDLFPHLKNVTSLKTLRIHQPKSNSAAFSFDSPIVCTLGANFWRLQSLSLSMGRQELHVPFSLPQLKTLELREVPRVREEWGRMLPNVERLTLLDVCASDLPALERGSWPRLTVLEVQGSSLSSISHAWFTLPSLRRFAITNCYRLPELPDIPEVGAGDHAPMRELEVSGCALLRGLPKTLVHLRELSRITIQECPGLVDVPSCLGDSGVEVVRPTMYIFDGPDNGLDSGPDSEDDDEDDGGDYDRDYCAYYDYGDWEDYRFGEF